MSFVLGSVVYTTHVEPCTIIRKKKNIYTYKYVYLYVYIHIYTEEIRYKTGIDSIYFHEL